VTIVIVLIILVFFYRRDLITDLSVQAVAVSEKQLLTMCEPMEDTSGECQDAATKPSYILRPGSMGECMV